MKQTTKNPNEIEYCRDDGRPSGLSLTKADAYIIVSPGFNSPASNAKLKGDVFKMRIYDTDLLKEELRKHRKEMREGKKYETDGGRIGSYNFILDPTKVPHIWVGDFKCVTKYDSYDTSHFVSAPYWEFKKLYAPFLK